MTPKCDWAGETRRYLVMRPRRTRADSRLSWIAISGLWINALHGSMRMIDRARLPETYDGYRYRSGRAPADWAFPTDDVATWICAIAVEALVVSVLLRLVTGSITGICLTLAALCGFGAFVMIPLGMHARTTFSIHAISLLFAAGWLIVMGIASALVRLVVRDRDAASHLDEAPPAARIVRGGKTPER